MKHDDEDSQKTGGQRRTPSAPSALAGHTVLIIDATAEVLRCACRILERRGIVARTTTPECLRDDATRFRPLMLLVDASVHEFDPEPIATVAHELETRLAIATDAKEVEAILLRLLAVVTPSGSNQTAAQARPRLELDTARMSANALQEAIDRMGVGRFEPETAKYDAETIREAIARMNDTDDSAG